MSAIGHVNSLMPRFEQVDDNDDEVDGEGRQASSRSHKGRDLSGKRRQLGKSGKEARLSPSNVMAQTISTSLKVPVTVIQNK